jgi:DNA polymerase-3 subunit delta'
MDLFEQTIGHKTAKNVLTRILAQNRLPHALLLVGPKHVGKTHIAHTLIKQLLKTDRPLETIGDVVVLKREKDSKTEKLRSQISVKQVRQLSERLALTSLAGSWKVAFIEEADRLSTGGANALLKTLEEPKGQTFILLRAQSVESVLPTVASRCQILRLSPVSRAELSDALEKKGLSKTEASKLAIRALGRPGLALRYLNDSELRAQKETALSQTICLFASTLPEQLRAVNELLPKTETDKARALTQLIDNWSEALRNEMLLELGCAQWTFSTEIASPRCAGLAMTTSVLTRMQQVREALSHNINPHLALEHIFLACHL